MGVKEDPAQCKEPKFLAKAGWVKKAPGRLLATYRDRYVHVEKTEIVVYESENLQNCLERLDLENYDKCHEIKSAFKKKHRLILIRSQKSGNKVHDVKFQAQTAEEKEAWIKALSDGISRAKNKVFDEVKVDESSNLEHVTRTRPKGNRNRRPPTRIHMKEVAVVSSDGILRLDLDLEDATMPNGTHHTSVDGAETPKEAIKVPPSPSNAREAPEKGADEEAQTEPEVIPQKKVIKPPMPPIKEAKPSETPEDEPEKDGGPEKKVLKPPMPPSKEVKPCVSPGEEATEEAKAEKTPDAKKKAGPPPTPPNKPSSVSGSAESQSQSKPNPHPPTPPSKEKKPSAEPDHEVQDTTDEKKEKEEDDEKEGMGTAVAEQLDSKEALASDDESESPRAEEQVTEEESGEIATNGITKASDNEPQTTSEPLRKSPSPLLTTKKKPQKLVKPNTQHIEDKTTRTQPTEGQDPPALLQTASDTSADSPQAEEPLPKSEVPSVIVSLNDPVTDNFCPSPLLCLLPEEKKKKAEEKSVDSGQHSDDDSEGSESEDTLAASTAALRGSHPSLDLLDASEDDIQITVSLKPTPAACKPQVRSKVFPCRRSEPTPPPKPSTKARSASIGDLLSDFSGSIPVRQHTGVVDQSVEASGDDVMKLEAEVAVEMENTSALLSRVSQSQRGGDGRDMPEDLLAKAMDKLKRADHVLREVKKLKPAENSNNRKSW
ncbi:pleckstrin homology domain-containing family O member 1-A isoform X2 [Pempheris klunzingeri]|uniref:pleckstrin homology domain-containing family O member 1-A isoform X2 n=1 Tax=Pempheris klunzingeri TaxID=3127111 RepID=UPI0039802A1F